MAPLACLAVARPAAPTRACPTPRRPVAAMSRPLLHDEDLCPVCAGHGESPEPARIPCRNCLGFGTVPAGLDRRP